MKKGDAIQDFRRVFRIMELKGICQRHSLLYEAYALFLVAKGNLAEANEVYQLGISRYCSYLAVGNLGVLSC